MLASGALLRAFGLGAGSHLGLGSRAAGSTRLQGHNLIAAVAMVSVSSLCSVRFNYIDTMHSFPPLPYDFCLDLLGVCSCFQQLGSFNGVLQQDGDMISLDDMRGTLSGFNGRRHPGEVKNL